MGSTRTAPRGKLSFMRSHSRGAVLFRFEFEMRASLLV